MTSWSAMAEPTFSTAALAPMSSSTLRWSPRIPRRHPMAHRPEAPPCWASSWPRAWSRRVWLSATLIVDGKSIGRHYAGPNWDHIDGSGVTGKAAASVPGATPDDIPWLKLDVVDHRGDGFLSSATTVQRINTRGGVLQGQCDSAGVYRSVPYSADYVFLRKRSQR